MLNVYFCTEMKNLMIKVVSNNYFELYIIKMFDKVSNDTYNIIFTFYVVSMSTRSPVDSGETRRVPILNGAARLLRYEAVSSSLAKI